MKPIEQLAKEFSKGKPVLEEILKEFGLKVREQDIEICNNHLTNVAGDDGDHAVRNCIWALEELL